MSSTVLLVRDDHYHPQSVIDPALAQVFAAADWRPAYTRRVRDLLEPAGRVDLVVLLAPGLPDGEEALVEAEEQTIVGQVRQGMGMLRVHAGLVLIEPESLSYRELNTGRFVSHPEYEGSVQLPVTYAPLRRVDHPILEGVESFGGVDEHYWCQLDVQRTDLLLAGTSAVGTSAAIWAHDVGAGRVAALIPGHTSQVLMQPMMLKLPGNAARWCVC